MAPAGANVIVAGGGIAGMTAALRLAERGCEVTIYEAKEVLGGNLASGLKAGMVRPLVFEAPEFDVYPHMYQAWYLNFWDLLEDAGVSIERDGTELRSVEGFTPFSSFHQLRRRDEFRRPQEKGLQRLATLTHPYSAGCMLQNLASGVAPPADMFTFGYAGVDLQAEVMNPTVRLQNMSLTGYLNSRRYLSKAAIDAYETFITTVWGLPAYLLSAGAARTYGAYCYAAAAAGSRPPPQPPARALIARPGKRPPDNKV